MKTCNATAMCALVLTLAAAPAHAAFPGPNGPIAFATWTMDWDDVDILTVNADGSGWADLTTNSAFDYSPAFSPDGSRIAFTSARSGDEDIYVMDRDGSDELRLTSDPGLDFAPAFSPDGSTIAFVSDRDGNLELYTVQVDGSGETRLTDTSANEQDPAFSPDGTQLAYASDAGGNRDIYLAGPDTASPVQLTDDPADDMQPNFAPDGARIAFTSTRENGKHQVYVMNADGSEALNLSRSARSRRDTSPTFSPDGTKVAFAAYGFCPADVWGCAAIVTGGIYAVNSDGSPGLAVIFDGGGQSDPDWSVADDT